MSSFKTKKRAIETKFGKRLIKKRKVTKEEKIQKNKAQLAVRVSSMHKEYKHLKTMSTTDNWSSDKREFRTIVLSERKVEPPVGMPEPEIKYYDDWLFELAFGSYCTISVWNGDFTQCYPSQRTLELPDKETRESMTCEANPYCLYYRGHKFRRVYRKNEWVD